MRGLVNWWKGRKRTTDEPIEYDAVVSLLQGLNESVVASFHGTWSSGVLFESTGDVYDEDNDPEVAGGPVDGRVPVQKLAELMGSRFAPYSEKYWSARHLVYDGRDGKKHYIDFTSTVPVENLPGEVFTRKYKLSLEFLVEQKPELSQSAEPEPVCAQK